MIKSTSKFLVIIFALLAISSCKKETPRIVYDNNELPGSPTVQDPENQARSLVADLPFSFDSLEYFYFPIGETQESFSLNLGAFNSTYSRKNKSFSLGYWRGNSIDCNLNNVLIRPKNDQKYWLLTEKELKIKSINYLFRIDTIFKKDRFLYRIIEFDSNKDNEINNHDLVGLFISDSKGKNLKRISPKFEQLIDWNTQDEQGLLFFRTMEDIDKNGQFDDADRINLYEYNLIKGDTLKLIYNDQLF